MHPVTQRVLDTGARIAAAAGATTTTINPGDGRHVDRDRGVATRPTPTGGRRVDRTRPRV